jgi:hypothetical protein
MIALDQSSEICVRNLRLALDLLGSTGSESAIPVCLERGGDGFLYRHSPTLC